MLIYFPCDGFKTEIFCFLYLYSSEQMDRVILIFKANFTELYLSITKLLLSLHAPRPQMLLIEINLLCSDLKSPLIHIGIFCCSLFVYNTTK